MSTLSSPTSSSSTTPTESDTALTWASASFLFPPCSDRPRRPPSPQNPRPKSAPTATRPTTSRVINNLPGFDDFADLVIASERAVPRLTITPSADVPTRKKTCHHRSHRSKPSEPKSVAAAPVSTASLSWSEEDNDAGRVTFIFGRFRPALARYSLPQPRPKLTGTDTLERADVVRQDSSHSSLETTTNPHPST